MTEIKDTYGRIHDYLRVSLTDKCNLNCMYCNPISPKQVTQINPRHRVFEKIKRNKILTFDEISRVISIFTRGLGAKKIRFTGGEPFMRRNIMQLFEIISNDRGNAGFKIGISTNGTMLKENAARLKEIGIDYLNISLDTLRSDRFVDITGGNDFDSVMEGIDSAIGAGYNLLKVNCVIMKGINDDEIIDFIRFAIEKDINVRFIEFMPFSGNGWDEESFLPSVKIMEKISEKYEIKPLKSSVGLAVSSAFNRTADDYSINGGRGIVSFISPISNHFCAECNRLRLTTTGELKLCLFSGADESISLMPYLRDTNFNDGDIQDVIKEFLLLKKKSHLSVTELAMLNKNRMLKIGG